MRGFGFVAVLLVFAASLIAIAQSAWAQDRARVDEGRWVFMNQGCYGCHRIGTVGTPIGADLSHVGAKYRPEYLQQWLRDPSSVRPSAHMPVLELSEDDIRALAAFLSAQQ